LGTPLKRKDPLFWEYGAFGSIKPGKSEHISPQLAIRKGPWKFLMNTDSSQTMLFNLDTDPGERNNLSTSQTERTKTMQQTLQTWWQEMRSYYP
ncbi:MAG: hypothetical protein MI922_05650, partial [Bacteroidales bacterium]|nr:hypothetical protein [Bacteroidales bacterium]